MNHALFLQKCLLVFYLGEEQLPSQPSHSIRELEHYFRVLCGIQLGILKHHTQQHVEQRFSLHFSIWGGGLLIQTAMFSPTNVFIILSPRCYPSNPAMLTHEAAHWTPGCHALWHQVAAPGGRRSGRHVKHMPSGWAQLPTVCCCHVGKLSLGAGPGQNAHGLAAVGDTYHNVLLAGQSALLACAAHPPWGGTADLTGFQSWSLCVYRYQRTWVILTNSSRTSL